MSNALESLQTILADMESRGDKPYRVLIRKEDLADYIDTHRIGAAPSLNPHGFPELCGLEVVFDPTIDSRYLFEIEALDGSRTPVWKSFREERKALADELELVRARLAVSVAENSRLRWQVQDLQQALDRKAK